MRQHDLPRAPNWGRLSPTYRKHIERRINNTQLLIAQIEVCRFRVRIEHALLQIEWNRRMADPVKPNPAAPRQPKNPKLRGLIQGIDQFKHNVDLDIDAAAKKLAAADQTRVEVFGKVDTHIAEKVGDLGDFGEYFEEMKEAIGDNGAPSSGGGSEGSQTDSDGLIAGEGKEG